MTDDINWTYADWMNSLLRPENNLEVARLKAEIINLAGKHISLLENNPELARLKAENEQLRTLLEEASDLLSDAVDVAKYGRDASGHFSVYKAEDWERRYRRVVSSKDEGSHDRT